MSDNHDRPLTEIEVVFFVPKRGPRESESAFERRCLREISKQWAQTIHAYPLLPEGVPLAPSPDGPCLQVYTDVAGNEKVWYPVGLSTPSTRRDVLPQGLPYALAYVGDATVKITHGRVYRHYDLFIEMSTGGPVGGSRWCKRVEYGSRVEIILAMCVKWTLPDHGCLEWVKTKALVTAAE